MLSLKELLSRAAIQLEIISKMLLEEGLAKPVIKQILQLLQYN